MEFNVDTFAIYRILSTDKKVREEIVQMAIANKDKYGSILDSVKIVNYARTNTAATDTPQRTVRINLAVIPASESRL